MIHRCSSIEQPGWLALRAALWSHCSRDEHLAEMAHFLTQPEKYANFVAYDHTGRPVGLAEASVRTDYVNGTSASPVGFLEGLYVVPESRKQGIGRALVSEVSNWALSEGCVELASDTQLENSLSQNVHEALGFAETERVVYYCKTLVDT
jgi:aminoglycoside 6'-N-acetyltransferase I